MMQYPPIGSRWRTRLGQEPLLVLAVDPFRCRHYIVQAETRAGVGWHNIGAFANGGYVRLDDSPADVRPTFSTDSVFEWDGRAWLWSDEEGNQGFFDNDGACLGCELSAPCDDITEIYRHLKHSHMLGSRVKLL